MRIILAFNVAIKIILNYNLKFLQLVQKCRVNFFLVSNILLCHMCKEFPTVFFSQKKDTYSVLCFNLSDFWKQNKKSACIKFCLLSINLKFWWFDVLLRHHECAMVKLSRYKSWTLRGRKECWATRTFGHSEQLGRQSCQRYVLPHLSPREIYGYLLEVECSPALLNGLFDKLKMRCSIERMIVLY
jgi:hypothetical protein